MRKNQTIEKDKKAAQIPTKRTRTMKVNNLTITGTTALKPIFTTDATDGINITDIQTAAAAQAQLFQDRYNQALSTSLDGLHALGIFVTSDGSLFQGAPGQDWSNYNSLSGSAWLPLQNIQTIENANGTAGTLMLHLQEPEIAKNTAGYAGGSSATFTGSAPTASTPVATVQALPPVAASPSGSGTVFIDPGTATAVLNASGNTPTSSSTNTSLPTTSSTTATMSSLVGGGKYWWLWYAIAAVIIIVYLKYAKK